MSTPRLMMDRIACLRGGRLLFEGFSLTLKPGEAALVTGPNGVGKSSLIRIAAGLLAPAAGTLEVEGTRALLAEAAALDTEQPLASAVGFWAGLDGGRARVPEALDAVGLGTLAEVPVRMLSTGQRRRAALARVVAGGADIWLLDEPVNGLDAASTALLEGLVARHRAAGGIVLVASHVPVALPGARVLPLEPAA